MVPSFSSLLPYDDFKICPQPMCSSKSHKYENYDETTHKVPPSASCPTQACAPGYSLPHG